MSDQFSRKDFVAILGTTAAVAAVPAAPAAAAAVSDAMPDMVAVTAKKPVAHPAPAMPMKPLGNEPEAYTYLTEPEAAFVEAAVARLIPNDHNGPGAKEAGVAFFIDQQLVGVFGTAAKMYRGGPWAKGTPMQGYQLLQTPAELYRQAIAVVNAYCVKTYSSVFAKLTTSQQDTVLKGLDEATITSDAVPLKPWFEMLLQNTTEGFFADPLYGGNRDKVGWKLVGFPGVAAYYANKITDWNKPYTVAPVSIADVQQGHPVAEGHEIMHHMAMQNAAALDKVNQ